MSDLSTVLDGYGEALNRLQAIAKRLPTTAQTALSDPAVIASLVAAHGPPFRVEPSETARRLLAGIRAAVAYAELVDAEFAALSAQTAAAPARRRKAA